MSEKLSETLIKLLSEMKVMDKEIRATNGEKKRLESKLKRLTEERKGIQTKVKEERESIRLGYKPRKKEKRWLDKK